MTPDLAERLQRATVSPWLAWDTIRLPGRSLAPNTTYHFFANILGQSADRSDTNVLSRELPTYSCVVALRVDLFASPGTIAHLRRATSVTVAVLGREGPRLPLSLGEQLGDSVVLPYPYVVGDRVPMVALHIGHIPPAARTTITVRCTLQIRGIDPLTPCDPPTILGALADRYQRHYQAPDPGPEGLGFVSEGGYTRLPETMRLPPGPVVFSSLPDGGILVRPASSSDAK